MFQCDVGGKLGARVGFDFGGHSHAPPFSSGEVYKPRTDLTLVSRPSLELDCACWQEIEIGWGSGLRASQTDVEGYEEDWGGFHGI